MDGHLVALTFERGSYLFASCLSFVPRQQEQPQADHRPSVVRSLFERYQISVQKLVVKSATPLHSAQAPRPREKASFVRCATPEEL